MTRKRSRPLQAKSGPGTIHLRGGLQCPQPERAFRLYRQYRSPRGARYIPRRFPPGDQSSEDRVPNRIRRRFNLVDLFSYLVQKESQIIDLVQQLFSFYTRAIRSNSGEILAASAIHP